MSSRSYVVYTPHFSLHDDMKAEIKVLGLYKTNKVQCFVRAHSLLEKRVA